MKLSYIILSDWKYVSYKQNVELLDLKLFSILASLADIVISLYVTSSHSLCRIVYHQLGLMLEGFSPKLRDSV